MRLTLELYKDLEKYIINDLTIKLHAFLSKNCESSIFFKYYILLYTESVHIAQSYFILLFLIFTIYNSLEVVMFLSLPQRVLF